MLPTTLQSIICRKEALRIPSKYLAYLEGALEAGGVVEATAHDEQRPLLVELLGDIQHVLVQLENLFDLLRKLPEAVNDLSPPGLEGDPVLTHDQPKHGQGQNL